MANAITDTTPDKLQPHNIEAEEAVLGSLLIDTDAIIRISTFLQPGDFYIQRHSWVYEAVLDLHERRQPADLVTLSDELARRNQLDEIGGSAYLTSLMNVTPTSIHVEFYARIVERTAVLRRLIDAAGKIAQLAYQDTEDVEEVVDRAEEIIFGVSERRVDRDLRPIRHVLDEYYDRIEYLHQHQGEIIGIPTGLADLDKLLGGLQRSDMVVMAGRPGMGKCVSADTHLVNPHSGELVEIKALINRRQANLLTLNEDYKLIPAQASDFVDDGVKPLYRVKTALGREIKVTLSHPFLTLAGWSPLSDLKTGDFIAVPRIIPVFGQDDAPEYEVKVLAYLLADGCLTGNSPQFTNSDVRLREDFATAAKQFPGTKTRLVDYQGQRTPTVYVSSDEILIQAGRIQFAKQLQYLLQQNNWSHAKVAMAVGVSPSLVSQWATAKCVPAPEIFGRLCDTLEISSDTLSPDGLEAISRNGPNSLTVWLQKQGLWGKDAATKEIPAPVYRYTRPKLALFLNRLFACDGSIYIQLGKQGVISYSTVSKLLAHGIQHLLLRFGIIAKLRHRQVKYQGNYRPAYELRITGVENLRQFIDEIGIFGKEKAVAKVKQYIDQTARNTNLDTIPLAIWEQIKQAKGHRTWRNVYDEMGLPRQANIHIGQRAPSRARLLAIGQALHSESLINIAQSDVYWDKIIEIEYLGNQQVYDLTVPITHNFVADDMIVHNTSLALSIALQAARRWQKRVAIFSLEMSDEQLVQRLVSAETGIDSQRLRLGNIKADEWTTFYQAIRLLSETSVYIDDTPAISALELRTKSRRLHAEHGLDLIIVDYLQLMRGGNRNENRQQEISFISRSIKSLARELNVPVLALSQLSRQVESRHDKRPLLSDLRESGSIEQDADVVLFIYRDEVYNADSEFPNIAEIIVSKHRSGPTGIFSVYFKKHLAQFVDLEVRKQPLEWE
jgi:replicative DNA helicase